MQYHRNLIFITIFSILWIGCASSPIVVMSDYQGKRMHAKVIGVYLEPPIILNPDDVADDLGAGIPDDVYKGYFEKQFPLELKKIGKIESAIVFQDTVPAITFPRELKIDEKQKIETLLPRDSVLISFNSIDPDLVLFIQKSIIYRGAPKIEYMPYSNFGKDGYTYSGNDLGHKCQFVLWDNKKGKIISYGLINASSTIIINMTKDNWEASLYQLANMILRDSPYYNSKHDR